MNVANARIDGNFVVIADLRLGIFLRNVVCFPDGFIGPVAASDRVDDVFAMKGRCRTGEADKQLNCAAVTQ